MLTLLDFAGVVKSQELRQNPPAFRDKIHQHGKTLSDKYGPQPCVVLSGTFSSFTKSGACHITIARLGR